MFLAASLHVGLIGIGVNSYWAQGLKPPPTFMIMGLAYMTSPPHFCDVILSKLCFNCLHWFYAMLTNRQLDHSFPAVPDILRKGLNLQAPLDIQWPKCFQLQGGFDLLTRGSAPGPCWGLCPQTLVIGSCSALAMVPPNSFCRLWSSCLEPPTYFDKFTKFMKTIHNSKHNCIRWRLWKLFKYPWFQYRWILRSLLLRPLSNAPWKADTGG